MGLVTGSLGEPDSHLCKIIYIPEHACMFCPVSDAVQVIRIRVVSCPDPFRKNQEGLGVWAQD